ncbi:MAG: MBL fold metallo-hydrolase [Chitinophagaceae bacterium]|nr:MBL fold metallo-hydrolase [Oligoflexus sp.]
MNELDVEILNGLQGDPAVYAFMRNSGESLLFDLGNIEQLAQKDLMKVRCVFVSHTHMDHFMGFDRWLRVNIPHKRLLKIWGPAPFFERVQAKLKAYAWNLIEPDQLRFEVHEIREDGTVPVVTLTNTNDFAINVEETDDTPHELMTLQDGSVMACVSLDHNGIKSLAYKIQNPDKLRFLHENLAGLGLVSGAWISQLQYRVRNNLFLEPFAIGDQIFNLRDLADKLLQGEKGESLVYLTDLSFNRKNIAALRSGFGVAHRIICESSFLDRDRNRAVAKAHLTTRQAALIAMALKTKHFNIFHVSTIYGTGAEESLAEAQKFFAEFSGLDGHDQDAVLEAEFREVEILRTF